MNAPRIHSAEVTRLFPVGPAAHLIALPDRGDVPLDGSAGVDAHLSQIEMARQRQLDELGVTNLSAVAAAYRATVEGILVEVRAARERVTAGLYGVCVRCDQKISPHRLERRPWATTCARCALRVCA